MASALLLDFGGVVHRSAQELLVRLGDAEPALRGVVERRATLGERPDDEWAQMMRREITEREYWAARATEIGQLLGQRWAIPDLMDWLFDLPEAELVRPEIEALAADARQAGIPVGVLSNDLAAFHDQSWLDRQTFLHRIDALVDASVTGVLKPDPRAYLLAADALGRPAGQIVFLDDIPWNVEGAQAAGMTSYLLDVADPAAAIDAARERLGLLGRAA